MEKMLAFLLLVYAIAFLIGECLRDYLYGEPVRDNEPGAQNKGTVPQKKGKKWKRYWGLFVLLKQKWSMSNRDWRALIRTALATFSAIVYPSVPT